MTITGPSQQTPPGTSPLGPDGLLGPLPAARLPGQDSGLGPTPFGTTGEASGGGGLKGIVRTIKRRQGVFLFSFGLVTGALALDTLRQRIFSPVYSGGFQIQISNPFETAVSGGGENKLETIARQTPKADVPKIGRAHV